MKPAWEKIPLGHLVEIASGQVDPRQVPYCDMIHVGGDNIESHSGKLLNLRTAGEQGLISGKYRFDQRDVLYSKIRPALNKVVAPTFEGICSADIYPMRPINGKICREFLVHLLRSDDFLEYTATCSSRTNIPKINRDALFAYEAPLPPLDEQRRIAAILDKADAIRRKWEKGIRLTEELLRSTFLDMFGDPATNHKGWDVVSLASLLAIPANYGTMIKPHDQPVGWLDLRVKNIQDGKINLSDEKYVRLPPQMIERHEVREGDLLLARAIGSIEHLGKCIVASPNGRPWAFDSHLMRLRFDRKKVNPEYVRQFLTSPGGRHEFLKHSRRSAVQFNINTKELARIRIPLPPLEEQGRFLSIASKSIQMSSRRVAAFDESEACFASLVQRAFRGDL